MDEVRFTDLKNRQECERRKYAMMIASETVTRGCSFSSLVERAEYVYEWLYLNKTKESK